MTRLLRRLGSTGLWWIPLTLVVVAGVGWSPARRDIADYFIPMRLATAEAVHEGRLPWLNPDNGCGEPWYANPQTGVLYPPQWLYLVVEPGVGMAAEVGFHLALLALGLGMLTRRLGGGRTAQRIAEAVGFLSGPVLTTVGMVNNLSGLAWLPWFALTASTGRWRWLAAVTSMAWLAGEPQVWALGCLLALAMACSRLRAVGALIVGALAVAVQLVPFVAWVRMGNRGLDMEASRLLSGGINPSGWLALVVPGVPTTSGEVWADSLLLGPVLVVTLWLGLRCAPRRLLVWAGLVSGLGMLATVGNGSFYLALTRGLVRYPSRFVIVALTALIPMIALGAERFVASDDRRPTLAMGLLALLTITVAPSLQASVVLLVTVLVLLGGALRPRVVQWRRAVVLAGLLLLAVDGAPRLGLSERAALSQPKPAWSQVPAGERLHAPHPAGADYSWAGASLHRRRLWPLGYLNLIDGVKLTTTPAPVVPAALAEHLRQVDAGPHNRWWLDALACRWVVLPTVAELPALTPVTGRERVWLHRNGRAWPTVGLAASIPRPGEEPQWRQGIDAVERTPHRWSISLTSDRPSWLLISQAPLPGWRWRLDDDRVPVVHGPGIIHGLQVPPGSHSVDAVYRPAGLWVGVVLSTITLVGLAVVAASTRIRSRLSAAVDQL